jgi:2-keto-4-pentenoate hydratase
MDKLSQFASAFREIFESRRLDRRPDLAIASLSLDEAYRVQDLVIEARVANGETVAGYKVGCTSAAIRRQFALSDPICGRLMHPYVFHGDTTLRWSDYHQPAVEPEFVLRIGRDVADEIGPSEPLERFVDCVSPGIEVHNYRFWFGEPTIQALVASNGIHACLVVGEEKLKPADLDWTMEGVGLFKNGHLAGSGIGAEIMGSPMASLRWLVNHLVRRGHALRAGQWVIPGSPVELVSVEQGDRVTARFTHLGGVEVTVA